MSRWGALRRREDGASLLEKVQWCDSFFCKLRGLMFRRELAEGEGLLMVEDRASRLNTSIHMLFMWMPLGVVWLDADMLVVDMVLAKPWRLAYAPSAPAVYTLESAVSILDIVRIGDRLEYVAEPV